MRKFLEIRGGQVQRVEKFLALPIGTVGIINREKHAINAEDGKGVFEWRTSKQPTGRAKVSTSTRGDHFPFLPVAKPKPNNIHY